jgi:hypothetical protein
MQEQSPFPRREPKPFSHYARGWPIEPQPIGHRRHRGACHEAASSAVFKVFDESAQVARRKLLK